MILILISLIVSLILSFLLLKKGDKEDVTILPEKEQINGDDPHKLIFYIFLIYASQSFLFLISFITQIWMIKKGEFSNTEIGRNMSLFQNLGFFTSISLFFWLINKSQNNKYKSKTYLLLLIILITHLFTFIVPSLFQ